MISALRELVEELRAIVVLEEGHQEASPRREGYREGYRDAAQYAADAIDEALEEFDG